mmetsp:Transcript_32044/g.96006  ORF Transcript_32044/g.96006 Transcript_32044/m.96006 type:complete len:112 (-) Transcript_32044:175-510(-)
MVPWTFAAGAGSFGVPGSLLRFLPPPSYRRLLELSPSAGDPFRIIRLSPTPPHFSDSYSRAALVMWNNPVLSTRGPFGEPPSLSLSPEWISGAGGGDSNLTRCAGDASCPD